MTIDLAILFFFYFTILFSILGYGLFFQSYFFKNYNLNLGITGLTGVFFLIIYSYLSHYIIAHNYWHNLIILVFGLIAFFFFLKKNRKKVFNFFSFNISDSFYISNHF